VRFEYLHSSWAAGTPQCHGEYAFQELSTSGLKFGCIRDLLLWIKFLFAE
jgi:hypothetical protein